ncbi:hypothetical protein DFJ74DRAFT_772010 [Hyaloraphidium curvatum]|nr:hypothetical protein DFJ74DRAFT_772010 [Hyaloraphidium curvatum]
MAGTEHAGGGLPNDASAGAGEAEAPRGTKRAREADGAGGPGTLDAAQAAHPWLGVARDALRKCGADGGRLRFDLTEALLHRVSWPDADCIARFRGIVQAERPQRLAASPEPPALPGTADPAARLPQVRSSLFEPNLLEEWRARAESLGQRWQDFYPPKDGGIRPFAKVSFPDPEAALAFRDLIWEVHEAGLERARQRAEASGRKGKQVVREGDNGGPSGPADGAGSSRDANAEAADSPVPGLLVEEPAEPQSEPVREAEDSVEHRLRTPDPDDEDVGDRSFTQEEADAVANLEALFPDASHNKVIRTLDRAGWNVERAASFLAVGPGDDAEEEDEEEEEEEGGSAGGGSGGAENGGQQGGSPAAGTGTEGGDGSRRGSPAAEGPAPTPPRAEPPGPVTPPQGAAPAPIPRPAPAHAAAHQAARHPELAAFYSSFPSFPRAHLDSILTMADGNIAFAADILRGELGAAEQRPAVLRAARERLGPAGAGLEDDIIWEVYVQADNSLDQAIDICRSFLGQ